MLNTTVESQSHSVVNVLTHQLARRLKIEWRIQQNDNAVGRGDRTSVQAPVSSDRRSSKLPNMAESRHYIIRLDAQVNVLHCG